MQVFVKTPFGKTLALEVESTTSVADIKAQLAQSTVSSLYRIDADRAVFVDDMMVEDMRVMYGGKQLEDESCLEEAGIEKASTLHLFLGRLRGGVIEPSMKVLAASYKCDKMICRK